MRGRNSCCSNSFSWLILIPWFIPEVFEVSAVASVESRLAPGGHVTVYLEDTGTVCVEGVPNVV